MSAAVPLTPAILAAAAFETPACMHHGGAVRGDGGCLLCGADPGERCRRNLPAKNRSTAVMAKRTVGGGQMSAELFDDPAPADAHGVMRPSGAGAVMASRAPTLPEGLDYFPTPPWAARAGGELITRLDPAARSCWEPAAGGGHMAHGLADYFAEVRRSDVFDHGGDFAEANFLTAEAEQLIGDWRPDWVVTNPPFKLGEQFVRRGWAFARRGVAMLLRLQFIEGVGRHALFSRDCPLSVFAPFCERVPMVQGRWDPEASSATGYAWFVWIKPEAAWFDPRIVAARQLETPVVIWIPPGTKARLSRPADLAAFGVGADPGQGELLAS